MLGRLKHRPGAYDHGVRRSPQEPHHRAVVLVRGADDISVRLPGNSESDHAVERGNEISNDVGAGRGRWETEAAVKGLQIGRQGEVDPPHGVKEPFDWRE